jgi:hypothetical protein
VPSTPAPGPLAIDSFGKMVTVPLLKPLHGGAHYILSIRSNDESLEVPFTNTTSLIVPDSAKVRTILKVKSAINLKAAVGQSVTVSRSVAKGSTTTSENYSAIISQIDNDGLVLVLRKELPSGKAAPLQLAVSGLTDNYGEAVKVQSKVQGAPSAPTNVSSAFVTTQISAIAAVHSSPTFSGTGAIAPWHPAVRMIWLPAGIFFDPAVTFDVGTSNAKASNSVIVPSQFSRAFIFGLPSNAQNIDPTTLVHLSPAHPIGVNTTFGPRAEFDTLHGGINLLGEFRAELYLSQLTQSVDVHKAVIAQGNPAIRDLLELPANGYSIAPYLQIDAGGHLTSQNISNPSGHPPASIPTYNISRIYLGIHGSAQRGRNTVSVDGSYVDLLLGETVPVTVNKIVFAKTVSSFQPHTKLSYSLYLDDAKHFAGSISWEDGRTAPSFQYLNKVTAGLQVTF